MHIWVSLSMTTMCFLNSLLLSASLSLPIYIAISLYIDSLLSEFIFRYFDIWCFFVCVWIYGPVHLHLFA